MEESLCTGASREAYAIDASVTVVHYQLMHWFIRPSNNVHLSPIVESYARHL